MHLFYPHMCHFLASLILIWRFWMDGCDYFTDRKLIERLLCSSLTWHLKCVSLAQIPLRKCLSSPELSIWRSATSAKEMINSNVTWKFFFCLQCDQGTSKDRLSLVRQSVVAFKVNVSLFLLCDYTTHNNIRNCGFAIGVSWYKLLQMYLIYFS